MRPEEIIELLRVLNSDVNACMEKINCQEHFDFWGRMYIRSLASMVEGTAHVYRTIILQWWKSGELHLNTEQQPYFSNMDWTVTNTGEIKVSEKRLPTKQMLKVLFKQCGYLIQSYQPNLTGYGWGRLMEFYPIRDALIHPKSLTGVKVTKQKLARIDEGRQWLRKEQLRINHGFIELTKDSG